MGESLYVWAPAALQLGRAYQQWNKGQIGQYQAGPCS